MNDLILGIDGGGTKTLAWLARLQPAGDERPLGRGNAGPGNMRAVGFDAALANLDAAIAAAFDAAGLPRTTVAAACFGLAGADRPSEQQPLRAWAEQRGIARRLVLTNDAEPILAAGSPENWGVAVISGTGSFGFARNQQGVTARCGGWGYLFGDEGSGYTIALAGLRAAVRAADGRGEATRLLEMLQQRLEVKGPSGFVETVYGHAASASSATRQWIADLADVVFQACSDKDPAAMTIVGNAALELAQLVSTLVHRLALPSGTFPLSIAGGVLTHHRELRKALETALTEAGCTPGMITSVNEPVQGAVALARRAATIDDDGTFASNH